jgi:hypothetical protein
MVLLWQLVSVFTETRPDLYPTTGGESEPQNTTSGGRGFHGAGRCRRLDGGKHACGVRVRQPAQR